MIALDAALRRLTVCQLTRKSRGNGGGLRPRVCLASGRLLGQLNYQAAGALLHQPVELAPACRRTRRSLPTVVAQMPR